MKVLSLFNGISGCHLALDKANIEVDALYYAEIDKYANKVTEKQYPDDIPLGDVTKWEGWDIEWSEIDLVTAGFPCQAWSIAGKGLGDKDERGMLFWTTLDIIKKVLSNNPNAKFMLENVKMKKEFEEYITHHTTDALGEVYKTLINSALVSAQNRNRYYWTNFEVSQPKDKGLVLNDIVESNKTFDYGKDVIGVAKNYIQWDNSGKGYGSQDQRGYYLSGKHGTVSTGSSKNKVVIGLETGIKNDSIMKNGKSYVLTASYAGAVAWNSCERKQRSMVAVKESSEESPNQYNGVLYRKLSPVECERLQNIPDDFTECISNTQRYKAIGNGWTTDVIAHIFKCAFKEVINE